MIPANVITRRSTSAALVGLLLVSACAGASESTTTTPPPASPSSASTTSTTSMPASTPTTTTSPPPTSAATVAPEQVATTPPTTAHPPETGPPPTEVPADSAPVDTVDSAPVDAVDSAPVDAVDVAEGTVFGIGVHESVDADAVAAEVSERLGSPTGDSGWEPMAAQPNCAGSTDFRVLWWGDFRMTFERYRSDDAVRDELSAWTVGDPTLLDLAPIGDVPATSPSGIVTGENIGLGSTVGDVEAAYANVNNGGDSRLVVVDRGGTLVIGLDDDDRVVGFGVGPFDCPVEEVR